MLRKTSSLSRDKSKTTHNYKHEPLRSMLSNYELLKHKSGLACIANNTLQVSLLDGINSGMDEVNLFKSPQQFRYRFYYD